MSKYLDVSGCDSNVYRTKEIERFKQKEGHSLLKTKYHKKRKERNDRSSVLSTYNRLISVAAIIKMHIYKYTYIMRRCCIICKKRLILNKTPPGIIVVAWPNLLYPKQDSSKNRYICIL